MTGPPVPTTPTAYPPSALEPPAARSPRPWYRRPTVLAVAAVVVVIAVTVVTDLPTSSNKASDIAEGRSVIAEISTDAQPCNLGLTESLGFYTDVTSGHITAAHRAQIPGLIRDDDEACSYTNASIDDLAGIDNPSSPTGKMLNTIATNVLVWCDPDALSAIGAITELIAHPGDAPAKVALARAERLLASDRKAAYANIAELAGNLGASMHSTLSLVTAPSP